MILILQFLLLGFVAGTTVLCPSIATSAKIAFLPMIILAVLPILKSRCFTLISVFCVAFVYMILPEAVLGEADLAVKWGEEHVRTGYRVLIFAFIAVYLGFLVFRKPLSSRERSLVSVISSPWDLMRARKTFVFLTIFCTVIFAPMIVYGLTTGRGSDSLYNSEEGGGLLFSVGILGYFLSALTYVVCGFWGYFYSKTEKGGSALVKAALWSSPIFLIGVASGTRYMLCFMLCATFLPWLYRISLKKMKWMTLGGLFFILLFSAMKNSRNSGFDFSAAIAETEEESGGFSEAIFSKGSPEGLVRNMAMIDTWTSSHPHTYGKSIGFLGFFWIPRFIWTEKPKQLDYWLIREYESGFGSGHSTASSFCGELFMDFGYFCIVASFVLGALMAKFDRYIDKNLVNGGFVPTVMGGIILGWTFFMVRSILTASYPLFLGGILVCVFSKTVLREKTANTPPGRHNN